MRNGIRRRIHVRAESTCPVFVMWVYQVLHMLIVQNLRHRRACREVRKFRPGPVPEAAAVLRSSVWHFLLPGFRRLLLGPPHLPCLWVPPYTHQRTLSATPARTSSPHSAPLLACILPFPRPPLGWRWRGADS